MTKQGLPEEFLGNDRLVGTSDQSFERAAGVSLNPPVDTTKPPLAPEPTIEQVIVARLSEFQMFLLHIDNKLSELERNVAYLLSKDPEYVAAVEKMQAEIERQKAAEGANEGSQE